MVIGTFTVALYAGRRGRGTESRTAGDILEPAKREVVDAPVNTPGKAKGNAFCDAMAEFDILANGIEERVGSVYEGGGTSGAHSSG